MSNGFQFTVTAIHLSFMDMSNFQTYIDQLTQLDPLYYYIALGVFILLIIIISIVSFNKNKKKRAAAEVAPYLVISQTQIAPLGKGVQIKFLNKGFTTTINDAEIIGKTNVHISQIYRDFLLETGKTYAVFCETEGRDRVDDGFDVVLYYTDSLNNQFKQQFHIHKDQPSSNAPRVVRYS